MPVKNIKKIQKKLSFSHTNCEEFQLLFHDLKHSESGNSKPRKYHRNNLYFAVKSHLYSILSNHSHLNLPHFRLQMSRASEILQRLAREVKKINIDKRSQADQYLQSHDFAIKIGHMIMLKTHVI